MSRHGNGHVCHSFLDFFLAVEYRKLIFVQLQARRQKFSDGGSFDTAGPGYWGRSRLPEALGYLVQNPAI